MLKSLLFSQYKIKIRLHFSFCYDDLCTTFGYRHDLALADYRSFGRFDTDIGSLENNYLCRMLDISRCTLGNNQGSLEVIYRLKS